jgi:hypothetical protein
MVLQQSLMMPRIRLRIRQKNGSALKNCFLFLSINEATLAGMGGNEEDARRKQPFAALWRRCFRRIGHLKK